MRAFLNFEKCAQDPISSTFSPKYNRPIKLQIADINLAVSDLNSAKTLIKPNDSMARSCLEKLISYFRWYVTIGLGGDVNAMGKDNLIPTIEEMKSLIKTGIFGESFILSLAAILKLNDGIPQFKTEFINLGKIAPATV